jgi:hypothetical protein
MMPKITAKVAKQTAWALLVEASDGQTYIRESQMFRGKAQHSFSAMPTIVNPKAKPAENVDQSIAWGRMPRAVRQIMLAAPVG